MTPVNAISLKHIQFSFPETPPVLENVNLEIERGEFLGIIGPNGGGKSTLLKIILGLLQPDRGAVRVLGKPPAKVRHTLGYVPQYASFERHFPITVEETVLLGRLGLTRSMIGYSKADKQAAKDAMAETEIADLAQRRLNTLSGGQFQRVLIARSLVNQPEIMILDEPTSNIDLRMEADIFDLLKEINKRATVIVVSHDIAFISSYVKRVACLNRTLVCHETDRIDNTIIETVYGHHVRMIQHSH